MCVCACVAAVRDPTNDTVLIEGVLFRANYLGSTQLDTQGHPTKATRLLQAQEAVGRIKVSLLTPVTRVKVKVE
jgi:hypothetical protein